MSIPETRSLDDKGCLLVYVNFLASAANASQFAEFRELAISAGAQVVDTLVSNRQQANAKFFVGKGKIEELAQLVKQYDIGLVMFDQDLSPAQERNIEREIKARVLDRTGLILDIFAQRARTFEGKLQVELAQLEHLSTRLVRGWTHLERQKGGIGLRGPGETQLETDRRLLAGRIKHIKKRLQKVRSQRQQGRQARKRKPVPSISLIGYTNAGKSTLFNRLTSADVYAADQLFATLDPTLRRIQIASVGDVVLADTVGFIRDLPHDLVDAFRATLEETRDADLLLHIVDYSQANYRETIEQVNQVLSDIDAENVPQLLVYNKIDARAEQAAQIDYDQDDHPAIVYLSAQTGEGIDLLQKAISERLSANYIQRQLQLTLKQAKLRAQLYQINAVLNEQVDTETGNCLLDIKLSIADWHKLGVNF